MFTNEVLTLQLVCDELRLNTENVETERKRERERDSERESDSERDRERERDKEALFIESI